MSDIFITTHELGLGLARRPCSYCSSPLMIRLPSMADAIRDQGSHALRLGFDNLTPGEREMFDVVYNSFPRAVLDTTVMTALNDLSPAGLRRLTFRLRAKLVQRDWLLISWHHSLRLVEPVPVV